MLKKTFFLLPLASALFLTQISHAYYHCRLDAIDKLVENQNTLNLDFCNLAPSDMPAIVNYLNQHKIITKLNLSRNNFDNDSLRQLVNKTQIAELVIKGYEGAAAKGLDADAAKILATSPTIKSLDISNNHIGDDGAVALAQDTNLTWLSLYQNSLTDKAALAFTNQPSVSHLNFGGNTITDTGAKALAVDTHLTELMLDGNISEQGVIAIAQMPQLTTLALNVNELSPTAVQALAQNSHLKNLDLFGCGMGDAGAQALSNDDKLETLNIEANNISNIGMSYIGRLTHLTKLSFGQNHFDDNAAKDIAKLTQLTEITVNNWDNIGAETIKVFAKLPHLQDLNLGETNTSVTDEVVMELVDNPSLRNFSFNAKHITNKGLLALANSKLTRLRIYALLYVTPSKKVMHAFAENKNLKELHLDSSRFNEDGINELAKSKTLETLDLDEDNTPIAVVKILLRDQYLKHLNLALNDIDDGTSFDILNNTTLVSLDISQSEMTNEGVANLIAKSVISRIDTWGNRGSINR